MITLETSTFGVMGNEARQREYLLVVAALDCVLSERSAWLADVMTWFDVKFIIDPELRELFVAILAAQQSGGPITDFELLSRLPASDAVPFQARAAKLYGLWRDRASQAANVRHYAKGVHSEYRRQHAADDLAGLSDEMRATQDPDRVLSEVGAVATKYAPAAEDRSVENARVLNELLGELDGTRTDDRFRFGITALDELLGGIAPGMLVTVGARTGQGKSVLLGQTAMKCALRDGKPALMFSLEMTQAELYKRWASALSRKPFGGADKEGRKQVGSALLRVQDLAKHGLLQVFTGPRNVEQITAEAMAYAARQPLGIIVVDYLQAVLPTKSRSEGREQQVAHIAASLKHLAMSTGVPVLTASQLNKAGEDNPRGSTLRESEAIGNYSNVVILLKTDPKG